MAIFTTPYTTEANYTRDPVDEIGVVGGLGRLEELGLGVDLHAYWKYNAASWNGTPDEVIDSSGNGFHGTAYDGANTIPGGHIGRAGSFDGYDDRIITTNNAGITGNPSFTISAWIYIPSGGGRRGTYPCFLSWGVATDPQSFFFGTYGAARNRFWVGVHGGGQFSPIFSYDTWHHFVWVRQGGGTIRVGNTLYIDNSPVSLTSALGDVTPAVVDAPFEMQRGPIPAWIECTVDELAIWNGRELTVGDVNELYNAGAGLELHKYSPNKPSIYLTAGHSDYVSSWNGYSITRGVVEGDIRTQLSPNGSTWYYWNGSAWVVAGASDYNTEATVDSNIGAFPTVQDKIYHREFLRSDGTQRVEIDKVEINYTSNQSPLVNAGANKNCKDGQAIKPFSDCSFSDPDPGGTVDFARYKVDGEVDVWTNIPQGGYATLLEAVQDFDYTFNNTGSITVRLQVEDNLGGTSEDDLTVTVTNYTRTVNIKHPITNEHIAVINFDPGDGSGFVVRNSPFDLSWDYGIFSLVFQASGYYSKVQSVLMNTEADLDLVMEPISYVDECKASVGWKVTNDTLVITTWLLRYGGIITSPTSCTINFRDEDGNVLYTDSSSSPNAEGVFKFEKSPSGLQDEGVYRLESIIVADGLTYPTLIPLGLIDRRVADFLTDMHDETLGEWVLDPDAKTLTLKRIDGSTLVVFDLTDTTRTLPSFIGRTPR
jgi:hypothetical protein